MGTWMRGNLLKNLEYTLFWLLVRLPRQALLRRSILGQRQMEAVLDPNRLSTKTTNSHLK